MLIKIDKAAHWYTRDGAPAYEVPRADGKGMRATTVRDARKDDLVPSVTTVLRVLANPVLEAWKQEQCVLSALTLPREDDESEDDYAKRVVLDSKETSRKAMTLGTDVHAAIEDWHMARTGTYRQEVADILATYVYQAV